MLDVAGFRTILPEFSDSALVPDAQIQFSLDLAYNSLNPVAWGDRLDAGAAYYAAHYIALGRQRASAIARGVDPGVVGGIAGVVTSKSVGGVSKSMDASLGQTEGGGSFNVTAYGRQYLDLLATVGIGVMQL